MSHTQIGIRRNPSNEHLKIFRVEYLTEEMTESQHFKQFVVQIPCQTKYKGQNFQQGLGD